MLGMTIGMCLWHACIAVLRIIPKYVGTVPLLGNITLRDTLKAYALLPDNSTFPEKFLPQSSGDAVPSTSNQFLPHEEEIRKQAQAAKCFIEEEQASRQDPNFAPLSPKKEGLKFSSLESQAPTMTPKHHIKQGPIKSSKN